MEDTPGLPGETWGSAAPNREKGDRMIGHPRGRLNAGGESWAGPGADEVSVGLQAYESGHFWISRDRRVKTWVKTASCWEPTIRGTLIAKPALAAIV